jgi:alpha-glucosidase
MFGPTIMVAPVVKKGRRRRDVYLPEGGWTDFWTGQYLEGPKVVSRDAPLETLPIYVRAGAALVMWPALPWLDPAAVDRVFIECFPPASGRSETVWYEDDGETDGHERGEFCKRVVGQERTGDGLTVKIGGKDGSFAPPARELVIKIRVDQKPESVRIDGKKVVIGETGSACEYRLGDQRLDLKIPDDFGPHEIVVS